MENGELHDDAMPGEPAAEIDARTAAKLALQGAMHRLPDESDEAWATRVAAKRHDFREAIVPPDLMQLAADYELPPDANS